jgi:hypothetical protein
VLEEDAVLLHIVLVDSAEVLVEAVLQATLREGSVVQVWVFVVGQKRGAMSHHVLYEFSALLHPPRRHVLGLLIVLQCAACV